MEFKILGPLEVYDASGVPVRLPTGRERALLVALLIHRGEVVSVDALVDALWGERPPSTAAKAVQGYVSHLRRLLGSGAGNLLVTQPPGYVLRVGPAQVDAARFEQLASEGQRALEDGDPAGALTILESALSLWRGPALAEFAFDDFAQRELQRLTERRLEAAEDRIDALLQLGRHGGLVSELEAVLASHPLRERSREQLMLALYRSGRPADALQVYKEGARLSREIGLDPAADLKRLERAILDQDPSIAGPTRAPIPAEPVRSLPAGTVTLLSSDIEGSTDLVRSVGTDTWAEILSRHRSLMRAAFAAHHGTEVDTQGDAFLAAFPTAKEAVAAAVDAQRGHLEEQWPDAAGVRVRIGLHTGAPTHGHERYVGLDVHRVARVAAAAHGSEILCTASTAALVDEEDTRVHFVDLGAFRLKDFPRPERLLRVVGDGLGDSFPPPVAEPAAPPRAARRRRRAIIAAVPALVVLAVLAALVLERARDASSSVAVVPPAVAVIDPESNRVVASLKVGRRPVALADGFGAVWVGDSGDNTVTRIDPANLDEPGERIGIGATAVDLAAGLGSIWVATGSLGEIVRIDPELNSATERFSLPAQDLIVPNATTVSATREGLWASATDSLLRLDPRTGRVAREIDLGNIALWIAAADDAVWVTTFANRAKKVDAASGEVTAEFYSGLFMLSIVPTRRAVWIGGDGGQVWKLDPETAAQTGGADVSPGVAVETFVAGMAVTDTDVWAAVPDDGNVVRLDPETADVEATIPLGGAPSDVLVAHGYVWVTVNEPDDAAED